MSFDVAVVGAGIVGAACAFEAARAGFHVIVIEQDEPVAGATGAGMGHVVVMDDSEAQFALTQLGCDLWKEVAADLPADCEYAVRGTFWVAAESEEMSQVTRKSDFYRARGVEVEILDAGELQDTEPNLRDGLAGALFVKHDAVIFPPCAARYLLKAQNITLQIGSATRLAEHSVCLSDGSRVSAEYVINAAGVDAGRLTPEIPIAIQPRKGHLLITDRHPGFANHQLVELGYLRSAHTTMADSVAFNVQPRLSGQVVIGSSRQFGAVSDAVEEHIVRAMLARAIEYMPGIATLSTIRAWTGFRAATADKLPLIGLVPRYSNVFVAAGHEGLGTTTALATGRLLIDQILNRPPVIPMGPYSPERTIKT